MYSNWFFVYKYIIKIKNYIDDGNDEYLSLNSDITGIEKQLFDISKYINFGTFNNASYNGFNPTSWILLSDKNKWFRLISSLNFRDIFSKLFISQSIILFYIIRDIFNNVKPDKFLNSLLNTSLPSTPISLSKYYLLYIHEISRFLKYGK